MVRIEDIARAALAHEAEFILGHRAFEPQQQAVVDVTGIADPVQVDHQGAGERAQVNEVVPVAPVAGEA